MPSLFGLFLFAKSWGAILYPQAQFRMAKPEGLKAAYILRVGGQKRGEGYRGG
jgi:hypothetical protein